MCVRVSVSLLGLLFVCLRTFMGLLVPLGEGTECDAPPGFLNGGGGGIGQDVEVRGVVPAPHTLPQ